MTTQSPETAPHTYRQLISDKGAKWGKDRNSRQIPHLHLAADMVETLKENRSNCDLGLGRDFFRYKVHK